MDGKSSVLIRHKKKIQKTQKTENQKWRILAN